MHQLSTETRTTKSVEEVFTERTFSDSPSEMQILFEYEMVWKGAVFEERFLNYFVTVRVTE